MTTIPNDTLYVDTFSDFMCNTTLSEYVDTPTTITYQWLGPSLLTTGADYNITGDTLRIKRFSMMRDNGRTITCMATVLPSVGQQYILQNNANESIQLTIGGQEMISLYVWCVNDGFTYVHVALSNAVFTPRIIIPGVPTAGDNFNIICRLDGVVERMVGERVDMSFRSGGTQGGTLGAQSQNGSAYILPHIFNPGMTDDVGTYTCRVTVEPPSGSFFTDQTSEELQIKSN